MLKLRTVTANLAAFLAPAAFEARARRREQLKLRRELAEIDETRSWCAGREKFAAERLAVLAREDSAATLATVRAKVVPGPEYWNSRSASVPRPHNSLWEPAGETRTVYGFVVPADAAIVKTEGGAHIILDLDEAPQ